MKKEYKQPLTETIHLAAHNSLLDSTVIQDEWADAKRGLPFDPAEGDEPEDTEDSFWDNYPRKSGATLWEP